MNEKNRTKAYNTFKQNVESADVLSLIYSSVEEDIETMPSYKELLRSEYVLLVSAFDTYFHHLILEKLAENLNKEKEHADLLKANKDIISVALGALCDMLFVSTAEDKYSSANTHLNNVTLQRIVKIENALYHQLNISNFRDKFMKEALLPNYDFDEVLNLEDIIDRRDKIVHESDIDPDTRRKRDISDGDIRCLKDTLELIVEGTDIHIDKWIQESK